MSPERRHAMGAVFRTLASRWPKVFSAGRVSELVPVWAAALEYVPTDVLEPAALQFCAESTGSYAPSPPEFSRFAKALHRRHSATSPAAAPVEIPAPFSGKDVARIEKLSKWAYRQLGTWPLVAEVWAVLMDTAPDTEHRQAVRDGTMDREVFREAVLAVQNGRRVMRRGPLSDLAGAA
jgi:hypothetical protein